MLLGRLNLKISRGEPLKQSTSLVSFLCFYMITLLTADLFFFKIFFLSHSTVYDGRFSGGNLYVVQEVYILYVLYSFPECFLSLVL